jgi:hypothetical protein
MESGKWKLDGEENGNWKMETGRGYEFPISSFQFPIPSFQFPVSNFQFPISSFQFQIPVLPLPNSRLLNPDF